MAEVGGKPCREPQTGDRARFVGGEPSPPKAGSAQARGSPTDRSCVPKAGIGLWTTGIRTAVRKEEVIMLQTPGPRKNLGSAGL